MIKVENQFTVNRVCYLSIWNKEDEGQLIHMLARNGYFVKKLLSGRIMVVQMVSDDVAKCEGEAKLERK